MSSVLLEALADDATLLVVAFLGRPELAVMARRKTSMGAVQSLKRVRIYGDSQGILCWVTGASLTRSSGTGKRVGKANFGRY